MNIIKSFLTLIAYTKLAKAKTSYHGDILRLSHHAAFISSIPGRKSSNLRMVTTPKPPTTEPPPIGSTRPAAPSTKPPPLTDDILQGKDLATKSVFSDVSIPAISINIDKEKVKEVGNNILENYVEPVFTSKEVVKDVPAETLKGAIAAGVGLSLVTGKSLLFSGVTGLGLAYIAVTPGQSGEAVRVLGKVAWSSGQNVLRLSDEYKVPEKAFNALTALLSVVGRAIGKEESLESFTQMLTDSGLKEKISNISMKIDEEVTKLIKDAEAAIATARESDEVDEEAIANIDDKDVTKLVEEAEQAVSNVQKIMDKKREEEEIEVVEAVEEDSIGAAQTVAEETTPLDDEIATLVQQAKDAVKDIVISEDDLSSDDENVDVAKLVKEAEEAIAIMQEADGGIYIDEADWQASVSIAESLDTAQDELNSAPDETELSMENLGKAARAAVEQAEEENKKNAEYEDMKVTDLKDILRSRGLKVGGKKTELITRLRDSD